MSENRVTYKQWQEMTLEEQQNVSEENLPEIPQEMLMNHLTRSVCRRQDGILGWETTQEVANGSNTRWFPEYKQKQVRNQMIWYKLDPTTGLYAMNLTETEPTLEEQPIGVYGMRWMSFMEEQYPELVEMMQFKHQYLTVARSVDRSAMNYRELLDEQFEQMNPRPANYEYEELLKWEQARMFYTDGTVMRERVLVPVTKA